jgi:hypothetical protein
MLQVLVWTVLICGGVALLWWAVGALATPEPLAKVVTIGSVVIAIIVIVFMWLKLLGFSAMPV